MMVVYLGDVLLCGAAEVVVCGSANRAATIAAALPFARTFYAFFMGRPTHWLRRLNGSIAGPIHPSRGKS